MESEWTIETLKELLEHEIKAVVTTMDERRDTYLRMTAKADQALEARLHGINEFRQQLGAQAASFVTRDEWSLQHQALEAKVDALEDRLVDRVNLNASRLERAEGSISANQERINNKRLDAGQLISVFTAILFAVSVTVGVIVAFTHH